MKKSSLILLACLTAYQANAQSTLYQTSLDKKFDDGFELYHKNQFSASKFHFEQLKDQFLAENQQIEAEFYHAVSALKLDNPDGPSRLIEFTGRNPDHPKANEAGFILGNYHFENRDYRSAITSFNRVNRAQITDEQRADVLFKTGYSFFQLKDYKNADAYFEQVKKIRSEYTPDAYYYSGYVAMEAGNFDKAIADFKEADKTRFYADKVPYMLSSLYYRQGYYSELIAYAAPIVETRGNLDRKEEIYLLLAEAYFEKRDFPEAARFYDAFSAARKGTMSRDQKYKAGVAQFEVNNFDKATNYFKEVALVNDKLGQVSSYYLGHSYLKLNNPQFAVNSFSAAYKSDFDARIKEEALFNYAKVSLERGVFQDAVMALDNYLDNYPQGARVREVEELLSDALVNTNNYLRAIEHIEKLPKKSDRIKSAYQKVAFYQGITYYNDSKFGPAINYFTKSQTFPMDRELVNQANFWKGESFAAQNKLQDAIKAYEAVVSSARGNEEALVKTHYGLGYAYLNTQQYDKAERQFRSYVDKVNQNAEKENYEDALVRLGDTYYVQKKFGEAQSTYQRAIQERSRYSDYAHFRSGVVLNFQNRNSEALRELNQVIERHPNSNHIDDVIFLKAQINMEETRYADAVEGFTRLINTRPNSPFIPYALEGRAVANYSLKNYDNTINDYKRILDTYPNSPNADAALIGLQETLSLQGRSGEFSQHLGKYRASNPDNKSLQNVEFEAAKNLFFSQSFKESIRAFEGYLRNYPASAQVSEAKYFIGDAYLRLGDRDRALQSFYELEKSTESLQRARAIQKIGEIEFEKNNYKKAIPYLITSSKNARNKIEEYEALRRLMTSYYETEKYDSANHYADRVITLGNVTPEATSQAKLLKAKSFKRKGDRSRSDDMLVELVNEARNVQGAEALYLLALSFHERGNFAQSNETIFDFSSPFGAYDYWYGRSFLLLADNYLKLGETFQAKATLESIVERSANEEIKNEARKKLAAIN